MMSQLLIRWNSGILRASAGLRRPASVRAFQPIKKSFAPALSARFASTDSAKDGKIYQVIGAVVDVSDSLKTKWLIWLYAGWHSQS
jgi:hypothetical protein